MPRSTITLTSQEAEPINDFLDFLAVEKTASIHTLGAYRNDLCQLVVYLRKRDVDARFATSEDLLGFIASLREKKYSKATVARRVACIKSFFEFLSAEGKIRKNPAELLATPVVPQSAPITLTAEEVDILLAEAGKKGTLEARRDRAAFELLYATGMRASELVALEVNDLQLNSTPPMIRCGTGRRTRNLPLSEQAAMALKAYVHNERPYLARKGNNPALFLSFRGKPFDRNGFWHILRSYAREAKISKPVSPNTLRDTFAMHAIENGMPLRQLQEALGHAHEITTRRYQKAVTNGSNSVSDIAPRIHREAASA